MTASAPAPPLPPFTMLRIERADGIAEIWLQRPERRNAISPGMASELDAALATLEGDETTRVVLLRGADGHFSSGGDLAPEGGGSAPKGSAASITLDIMNRVYGAMVRRVHHFPKPILALVEGTAAGAGANLAFACDLVYATPDARFCEIFVRRGLALDCGGSWLLPRLVGLQRAKELAYFGDWIPAPRAESLGLVTAVFESDAIEAAVRGRAQKLAAGAPIALGQIKQSLHRALSLSMDEALEVEAIAQAACSATEDMQEGVRAFMERREPDFKGR